MATINNLGNITAHCPDCDGALSNFEWRYEGSECGAVTETFRDTRVQERRDFRLYRCAGCGRGSFAVIEYDNSNYPGTYRALIDFYPETKSRLPLPKSVPKGISAEFREAEDCLAANCARAAAGMFRSVLEKTMRTNGYKTKETPNLLKQIDAAAEDGIITQARKRRAHEEIRVLGNDILHEKWRKIEVSGVALSHLYCQRILEDFYDERESVLAQLKAAARKLEEVEEEEAEEDIEATE